jgi:hypothetical protein
MRATKSRTKTAARHHVKQAPPPPPPPPDRAVGWELFSRCQRSPVLRSQLFTALMAGTPLELDRLLSTVLADTVLLCMVSRVYHQAEIIDDYQGLLDKVSDAWRNPEFTHRVFDSIHLSTVSFITQGTAELKCVEDQYIVDMVQWYLEHEAPVYFSKEL